MVKTLKELLEEDGYTWDDDRGLVIYNGCITMTVSRRYLEGSWENVLSKRAVRLDKAIYQTLED